MLISSGFLICRRLQNRWRYTTWPAALSCAPRERGVEYDRAFEELAAELRKRELPDPSQVHLDWFHSSKTAARRVWPAILCRRGNEHLRRNLLRNQARGTRKPKRPGGAQAHAKANAKARPDRFRAREAVRRQQKRAPHLTTRSIWAFLNIHARLVFCPSATYFHVCLSAVISRIREVWGDSNWADYFLKEYCAQKSCNPAIYGVSTMWAADWYSGPSAAPEWQPMPPSSQQAPEQFNSKFKRDLRSQGPLTTHEAVLQSLLACVDTWLSPLSARDAASKAPVTLLVLYCS